MEFLSILLAALLGAMSPINSIIESVVGKQMGDRLHNAKTLEVRLDNRPTQQILNGKVDRLRIASRDVDILPNLRLAVLDVETDPLAIDMQQLRQGDTQWQTLFKTPFQAGIHLVITEKDLNQTLRSPEIIAHFQPYINRLLNPPRIIKPIQYQLTQAEVDFMDNNRFNFHGQVQTIDPETGTAETADLKLAFTIHLNSGSQLQLIQPTGQINGENLPPQMMLGFAQGVSKHLNLDTLQKRGITARILQLSTNNNQIDMATFLRLVAPPSESQKG